MSELVALKHPTTHQFTRGLRYALSGWRQEAWFSRSTDNEIIQQIELWWQRHGERCWTSDPNQADMFYVREDGSSFDRDLVLKFVPNLVPVGLVLATEPVVPAHPPEAA